MHEHTCAGVGWHLNKNWETLEAVQKNRMAFFIMRFLTFSIKNLRFCFWVMMIITVLNKWYLRKTNPFLLFYCVSFLLLFEFFFFQDLQWFLRNFAQSTTKLIIFIIISFDFNYAFFFVSFPLYFLFSIISF